MWQSLTNPEGLEGIRERSKSQPQILFKHSTRCSISRVALSRFDREPTPDNAADFHLLDLLNHRSLSAMITELFGISHESPQVLLIKNGICVYHANHLDIEPNEVYAALSGLGN